MPGGGSAPRKQLAGATSIGGQIQSAEDAGLNPAKVTWADMVRRAQK